MCVMDECKNKAFSKGMCLRHYRFEHYGVCSQGGCLSPACGNHGECDNCRRRGPANKRHIGKVINTESHKYCEGCKEFLSRDAFYVDRGNSAYLCKICANDRKPTAKRRAAAWKYGIKNVLQTQAGLCVRCWEPYDKWEVDHIIPTSWGGGHSIDNLQIMCVHCNRTKSNNEAIDYRVITDEGDNTR